MRRNYSKIRLLVASVLLPLCVLALSLIGGAHLLFAAGGYELVGWVSVGCCLAAAALALRFPEAPRADDGEHLLATLRTGVREAVRTPGLRAEVAEELMLRV